MNHAGTGVYQVTFVGLGARISDSNPGVAHATAYDTAGTLCKADLPSIGGSDLIVNISCWSSSGTPLNSRFTLALFPPRDPLAGSNGFAYDGSPTAASYSPGGYSYNSSGQPISINRSATGLYSATFLSFLKGPNRGSMLVSALAANPGRCNAEGWLNGGGIDWTGNVDCYDAAGNPADDSYALVATGPVTSNADMGLAYALIKDSVADSTVLSDPYWSNSSGGSILVNHKSVGSYWVTFMGYADVQPARSGNIQMTPYQSKGTCTVEAWGGAPDVTAYVSCYSRTGAPADASFTIWAIK